MKLEQIILLALFVLFFLCVAMVSAHEAPIGWKYDPSCCSGDDCKQAPQGAVRPTDKGYYIEELELTIPYGSHVIEKSGDSFYHICSIGSYVPCLYVPRGTS